MLCVVKDQINRKINCVARVFQSLIFQGKEKPQTKINQFVHAEDGCSLAQHSRKSRLVCIFHTKMQNLNDEDRRDAKAECSDSLHTPHCHVSTMI